MVSESTEPPSITIQAGQAIDKHGELQVTSSGKYSLQLECFISNAFHSRLPTSILEV
jgi:hypothetical protein